MISYLLDAKRQQGHFELTAGPVGVFNSGLILERHADSLHVNGDAPSGERNRDVGLAWGCGHPQIFEVSCDGLVLIVEAGFKDECVNRIDDIFQLDLDGPNAHDVVDEPQQIGHVLVGRRRRVVAGDVYLVTEQDRDNVGELELVEPIDYSDVLGNSYLVAECACNARSVHRCTALFGPVEGDHDLQMSTRDHNGIVVNNFRFLLAVDVIEHRLSVEDVIGD